MTFHLNTETGRFRSDRPNRGNVPESVRMIRFDILDYEFVLQWCSSWWKFPRRTWVRVDKGNYSMAVNFFWVEFFVFW